MSDTVNSPEQKPIDKIQDIIYRTNDLYTQGANNRENITPGVGQELAPEQLQKLSESIQLHTANNDLDSAEPLVFLASVSKIAWVYFLFSTIRNDYPNESLDSIFIPTNFALIHELLGTGREDGREPTRILQILQSELRFPKPTAAERYPGFAEAIKKYVTHIDTNTLHTNANWEKFLDTLYKIPAEDFYKIEFSISLKELAELTLVYSCNSTVASARAYIERLFQQGDEEEITLNTYIAIRQELQKLVPSFRNTFSTGNNMHWRQPDANIGKLSEFADFVIQLIKKSDTDLLAKQTLDEMAKGHLVNNGKGFGHDFSTTETAKQIREMGGTVYEKTGYYPVVYWVRDLAHKGPHMSLSTVVVIKLPSGKTVSLSASLDVPIPITTEFTNTSPHKPAYETEEREKWMEKIFAQVAPVFQNKVEEYALMLLNNK